MPQYNEKWKSPPKGWDKTSYGPEVPRKMIEWFQKELEDCLEVLETDQGKKFNFSGKRPPSIERCAHECFGVVSRTLREWKSRFPEFAEAYEMCDEIRRTLILDGGLMGAYSETITKFLLTNQYKEHFAERKEISNSFGGNVMFSLNAVKPNQVTTNLREVKQVEEKIAMPFVPITQNAEVAGNS